MPLFRRATPPTEAGRAVDASEGEDAGIEPRPASFLAIPESDSALIAKLIHDGLAAKTLADQAAATQAVAAELEISPADVARPIAEAEHLARAWRWFINDQGLAERPAPDRLAEDRAILPALERQRERLEARLKIETSERKRLQVLTALDDIESRENAAWARLHPPYIVGQPADPLRRCRCGGWMTPRENYAAGCCSVCQRTHELVNGTAFPSLTEKEPTE